MKRIAQIGLGKLAVLGTIATVFLVLGAFGQEMFSSGPLSEQSPRQTRRGGVASHAEIQSCSACHAPAWSSETMASRCLDCHDNIKDQLGDGKAMHGLLANGQDCTSCHTEHKGPHAVLTNLAHFDHDCAAFKLNGKHRQLACAACHHDKPFQGTPQTCVACHAEPAVHQGKFGLDCRSCHSEKTWKTESFSKELFAATKFDHDCTGFKLTGKHTGIDCQACHVPSTAAQGQFKGLSQSCVSCHAEPVLHKGKFGVDCQSCHGTKDWKSIQFNKETFVSIKFDHDTTAFKLTGKHANVDCRSCHAGNTFKGTPTSCMSCHSEPANHKPHPKSFGQNCAECHTTQTWKGVSLVKAHRFPMNHRTKNRQNSACIVCHKDPLKTNFVSTASPSLSYATYTCYGCHQHTPAREAARHARRKMTAPLASCATCHPTGGGNRKGKNTAAEVPVRVCPVDGVSTDCTGRNPFAGITPVYVPKASAATTQMAAPLVRVPALRLPSARELAALLDRS